MALCKHPDFNSTLGSGNLLSLMDTHEILFMVWQEQRLPFG